jgi:hypothetical protein
VSRRRTGDWVSSARATEYGIALSMLRRSYEEWAREEGEAIDVVQAVDRFLKAEAKVHQP